MILTLYLDAVHYIHTREPIEFAFNGCFKSAAKVGCSVSVEVGSLDAVR